MTSTPLVSICIPVYNRKTTVVRAVHKALAQSYENIEVICCDNASTDGTFEVLRLLAEKDSRLKVYQNPTNLGAVRNWARCVEMSSGDFIKIVFSDDWIEPNMIKESLSLLTAHPDAAFASTAVLLSEGENKPGNVVYSFDKEGLLPAHIFFQHHASHHMPLVSPGAALFRKMDLIASIDPEIPGPDCHYCNSKGMGNDSAIFFKILRHYGKFVHTNMPLSVFSGSIESEESGMTASVADAGRWHACYRNIFEYYLNQEKFSSDQKFLINALKWLRDSKPSYKRFRPSLGKALINLFSEAPPSSWILILSKPVRRLAHRRIKETIYHRILKKPL